MPPLDSTPGSVTTRSSTSPTSSSSTDPANRSSFRRSRVDSCRSPPLEVSSTDLRARFTDGRPLDYLITEPVLDVIAHAVCIGASDVVGTGRMRRSDVATSRPGARGRSRGRCSDSCSWRCAGFTVGASRSSTPGGRGGRADARRCVVFPATPNALLAVTDDDGRLASLVVAHAAARRSGGSIVTFRSMPTPVSGSATASAVERDLRCRRARSVSWPKSRTRSPITIDAVR